MMQMVIDGVSTRKVENITKELCGISYSKSTVSNICKDLTNIVDTWKNRDLKDNSYPFMIIDAVHIKVRENHQVTTKSTLIALGINDKGVKHILCVIYQKKGFPNQLPSFKTIYNWLYSGLLTQCTVQNLRHKGKSLKNRTSHQNQKSQEMQQISIWKRPKEAKNRERIGDFEID